MRLGVNLGYVTDKDVSGTVRLAQAAEDLGFAVAWAAEAYGSDAPTVLSFVAARTQRIDVGAAAMQIPARTPAMTAMTAATLDLLSGGRFRLGLGVSGPQVSEGWHGVPFAKPLARTREYVDVVRRALARETVSYDGEFIRLPLPGGAGKPLKLTVHPPRNRLPLYLAAVGPKNLHLCGEVADGWLAIFFSPGFAAESVGAVRQGQVAAGRDGSAFDICATVPVSLGDDLDAAAAPVRGYAALYVGGMGSRTQNFYNRLARRMGFEEAAEKVQNLFLARKHREAMAAVPLEFVDQTSLIGTRDRIADRMQAFADAGVTTLTVAPFGGSLEERLRTLRTAAEALEKSGVGD